MIKKNLIKKLTIGLCMTAFLVGAVNVGTAFAQSGGGTSSSSMGTIDPVDSELYEKQREMDQYLFVDHTDEIAKMGFKVIYTGVAENYVEVGITPYNEEFAAYLYDKFGKELVKVVDTEEAVLYDTPVQAPDVMPADSGNVASPTTPIMDMGEDTPVSDSSSDEALIKEREQAMDDEEEKFTIQIESIDGDEPADAMDPELIWQTGVVEDLPVADIAEEASEDDTDIRLVAADDMAKVTIAGDIETEDKGLPTASIIAIVAAGIIIIGGTAYASAKKKAVKKN
ncbi:MAG: hypothetical protein EWM47_11990 [Anaerolineaceae bacterium]|nr:MAG: hypothetical protein EWM47_11990 [Anaerolineaceae bacterium]